MVAVELRMNHDYLIIISITESILHVKEREIEKG